MPAIQHDPQPTDEQEDERIALAREADRIINGGDEDEDD